MPRDRNNAPRTRNTKREHATSLASSALSSIADAVVHSRVGIVAIILVALVLFGGLFDTVANGGKAYSGVSVGGVDVGGMNAEQIEKAVGAEYEARLASASVTVYANQEAMEQRVVQEEYGDEVTVEEERANRVSWPTDSESLQAYIDYEHLAERVLAVGRGNLAERFSLLLGTKDIAVPLTFNEALVDNFASQIDNTIGSPLVDFNVAVEGGHASVTEGRDGDIIDRDQFKEQLAEQLLSSDADNRAFVATTVYTPCRISREDAQAVADSINKVLSPGIRFVCEQETWTADAFTAGNWVETSVERKEDGTYALVPDMSPVAVRSSILENIKPTFEDGEGHVRFSVSGETVTVNVTSKGIFPLVGDVAESLGSILFGGATSSAVAQDASGQYTVTLATAQVPEQMSFDDALSYGVISPVSEFTTEYATGAAARNTNIHLASDLINDSVIKADGGVWSFNETAGECNEAKGFKAATAISGDTTIDEIGGGICQVATTVFNSVYLAGYPIVERYNHSLYIPSYPQGRDASISWPSPDFKWQNDTSSDLLLRMAYTDSSVTATLYGVDPGYTVESTDGEWLEGNAPSTVYENDDTLPSGMEYVKTVGSNGHSITVNRTVTDADGEIIRQDSFLSVYSPQNTVIVRGTA